MVESPTSRDIAPLRDLADRILASTQLCRSARLSELFQYLCRRVLEDDVQEIHELEVGQRVFGRPAHYDTTADNIVRVHASLLRKRLAEYFENEGRDEEFIVKIPRGNYAPVFLRRASVDPVSALELAPTPLFAANVIEPAPALANLQPPQAPALPRTSTGWLAPLSALAIVALALLSGFLYIRLQRATTAQAAASPITGPLARQFWSSVFPRGKDVDVVIDDASLGLYEEATGKSIPIGDYFDRTYMRALLNGAGPPEQDPNWLHQLILRRQSNYATSSLVWRLAQIASGQGSEARLQFARDLSFQQAKRDNLVLLGTAASNPWIQLFESSLTLHWAYDSSTRSFYPVDATQPTAAAQYKATDDSKTRDGFATISLVPNLSGSGKALIISGSGGAATDAAMNWLMRDSSLQVLRSRLPQNADGFQPFEALLRVEKGIDHPRSVTITVCRPLRPHLPAAAK